MTRDSGLRHRMFLGWHVCRANFGTKVFFGATNFLMKNAPKFPPKFLSLYFVGPKKSAKFPPNFPRNFPPKKQNKVTDELPEGRRENMFVKASHAKKGKGYQEQGP